tara:strand:- start:275 stop:574 length:300 start_codon:yes stop_codon:yes gene_type:complete
MLQALDDSVVKLIVSIKNGFLSDEDITSTFIVLLALVPKQLVAFIVKENDNSFTDLPDITPLSNERAVGNIELKQGLPEEIVPSPRIIVGLEVAHTVIA